MEIGIKEINLKHGEEFKIFFMGDVHFGSASTDHKALRQGVHKIIETSNNHQTAVCFMGDMVDAIIHGGDPRFDPSEIDERYRIKDLKNLPKLQTLDFYEVVKPIADLVVSANAGNHEEQYIKRHSFDVYGLLRDKFPNIKLLGAAGYMRFKLKIGGKTRKSLDVGLVHGTGGGGLREGYPINKVFDTFRWWQGDIMVMGHLHQMATHPGNRIWVSPISNKLEYGPCWHGANGCFMLKHKIGCRNYFEPKPGPLPGIGMLMATAKINQIRPEKDTREWVCKTTLDKVWLR